jgi:hypothetical protein
VNPVISTPDTIEIVVVLKTPMLPIFDFRDSKTARTSPHGCCGMKLSQVAPMPIAAMLLISDLE